MAWARFDAVHLFWALGLLAAAWAPAHAEEQKIPYTRPDVLTLRAKTHAWIPEPWGELKRAQVEAVLEILALHPNEELYFMARDAELLYDTARLLLKDQPAQLARIHLLNVSRGSIHSPHLGAYLAQEGISQQALNAGKKFVFIDTAYSGSMGTAIAARFSGHRSSFDHRLMRSVNPKISGSRVFFSGSGQGRRPTPGSHRQADDLTQEISLVERNIPHSSARSDGYAWLDGKWQPTVEKIKVDGLVSAEASLHYQEDLRAYIEAPETQALVERRRQFWADVRSQSGVKSQKALQNLLTDPRDRGVAEDLARDWIQYLELHGKKERGASTRQKLGLSGSTAWEKDLELEDDWTRLEELLESGRWKEFEAALLKDPRPKYFGYLNQPFTREHLTEAQKARARALTLDWLKNSASPAGAEKFAKISWELPHFQNDLEMMEAVAAHANQLGMQLVARSIRSAKTASDLTVLKSQRLHALSLDLARRGDHAVIEALLPWGYSRSAQSLSEVELAEIATILSAARHNGEFNPALVSSIRERLEFEPNGRNATRLRELLGIRKEGGGCQVGTLASRINLIR